MRAQTILTDAHKRTQALHDARLVAGTDGSLPRLESHIRSLDLLAWRGVN